MEGTFLRCCNFCNIIDPKMHAVLPNGGNAEMRFKAIWRAVCGETKSAAKRNLYHDFSMNFTGFYFVYIGVGDKYKYPTDNCKQ